MDSSVVLICEKKFPEQSWIHPCIKKYIMLYSGGVVYVGLICVDLNIRQFENFLCFPQRNVPSLLQLRNWNIWLHD
jgi:hypothetical protein